MTTTEVRSPEAFDVDKPAADDMRFWSVTTILKVLGSEGLIGWAAKETAEAAIRAAKSLPTRIAEDGPEATARWLSTARYRPRPGKRSATERGSLIHKACEAYALTGYRPSGIPADIMPFVNAYENWCDQFQPEYEAAEMTVYDTRYRTSGTLDGIMRVGGVRAICDYKSTDKDEDSRGRPTKPYPEAALQLAAYRYSEFAATWRARRFTEFNRRYYLLSAEERAQAVPMPEVDCGLVIHITPTRCNAHVVDCGPETHRSFLHVVEVARFMYGRARDVIGDPLIPVI